MVEVGGLGVPGQLRRNRESDATVALDAAVWLIDHMSSHVGVSDLGALEVLDVGCGFRFTQAFLERGIPIGHYVGVDAAKEVIDFLRGNVDDPRLEFVHLDAHNALYNPTGVPLSALTIPELQGRTFDLVCLFSVFTHLAPHDYVAMLELLRRYAKPDTRLFFTVFIDELTEGGFGYMDRVHRAIAEQPDLVADDTPATPPGSVDFVDLDPARPLHVAMYSRRHALELIDGTGWRVLDLAPPDRHLQHHMVCAPA